MSDNVHPHLGLPTDRGEARWLSPGEHYAQAEQHLAQVAEMARDKSLTDTDWADAQQLLVTQALVHATLALADPAPGRADLRRIADALEVLARRAGEA